jgi:hypothetical protein
LVTVKAPPSPKTGPSVAVEKVWSSPEHFARARFGAATATKATSEAPASSEACETLQVNFETFGTLRPRA